MIDVKPRVFLIAETRINPHEIEAWLDHVGGTECLTRIEGNDGEQLIEFAGRNCYRSFTPGINPNVTKVTEDSKDYHRNYISHGHGALLEHACISFAFEDVSRVFTHELVRHRAGMAYSQVSLRYVRLDELKFWIPPDIVVNEEAMELFRGTVENLEEAQKKLAAIYDIDSLPFSQKKMLTSSFRRIAPIGVATGIVATFNMRALRHVLAMRTSAHAEVEIRQVFREVYDMVKDRYPLIFQDASTNEQGEVIFEFDKV